MDKNNPKSAGRFSKQRKGKKFFDKKKSAKEESAEILTKLAKEIGNFDYAAVNKFANYPLSEETKRGLKDANYEEPTPIQKESIHLALRGKDILGAAKTGSGKTLAFLIPILESLFKLKWSPVDGLGALIITPTRELAIQIFQVLNKVGKCHDFSAGLVIGGSDAKAVLEEERLILTRNIVVCTPGRMLQHLDQAVNFYVDNLHILVLDEADRILDEGFKVTINAILENLPQERQTLLFSATQTKSVKDLARLSLKLPVYVSPDEYAKHSTPETLSEVCVVCELHQKLDLLWSFLRNHLKQKILVFFSTCKQVRYVYQIMCRLQPGIPLLLLHGAIKQKKRREMYEQFCRKEYGCLFATNVAARGLDFSCVHWVVQMDCPEDTVTYIHRVGRTARNTKTGNALLVLMPSEKEMLQELEKKKIPINIVQVDPKNLLHSIESKINSLCSKELELKEFAQRAFIAYLKFLSKMGQKNIFDAKKLDLEKFAKSFGLNQPPRLRFLEKKKKKTEVTRNDDDDDDDDDDGDDDEWIKDDEERTEKTMQVDLSDEEDNDCLLKAKRIPTSSELPAEMFELPTQSKKRKRTTKVSQIKKLLKSSDPSNSKSHIIFDEEGEVASDIQNSNVEGMNLEEITKLIKEEDKIDKKINKDRIAREKKLKKQKIERRVRVTD